ncbi:MAG: hypothetical protein AAF412_08885, partial [Pseudomonadota bacterium]
MTVVIGISFSAFFHPEFFSYDNFIAPYIFFAHKYYDSMDWGKVMSGGEHKTHDGKEKHEKDKDKKHHEYGPMRFHSGTSAGEASTEKAQKAQSEIESNNKVPDITTGASSSSTAKVDQPIYDVIVDTNGIKSWIKPVASELPDPPQEGVPWASDFATMRQTTQGTSVPMTAFGHGTGAAESPRTVHSTQTPPENQGTNRHTDRQDGNSESDDSDDYRKLPPPDPTLFKEHSGMDRNDEPPLTNTPVVTADPNAKSHQNQQETQSNALKWALGIAGGLTVAGIIAAIVGIPLGWYGSKTEDEEEQTEPRLTDLSQAEFGRDDQGNLTEAARGLRAAQVVADTVELDYTSVLFYDNLFSAKMENNGSATLKVKGGVFSARTVQKNGQDSDVEIVFTPDGTSKADPPVVWITIASFDMLRSNAAKVTFTYVQPQDKSGDGTGKPPKALDYEIKDKYYLTPFVTDPLAVAEKGSGEIDPKSLVLFDGTDTPVTVLNFGMTSRWEVTDSEDQSKKILTFYAEPGFDGTNQKIRYGFRDKDLLPSNIGTIKISFLIPPRLSTYEVGILQKSKGNSVTVDVLPTANKGT